MILAVGQEKQNELMIFFSYWFGLDFFFNQELPSALGT